MSSNLKKEVILPNINWDKILVRSALLMAIVTILGFASRWKTILIAAEFIDVAVIVGLLVLAAFALIVKSVQSKSETTNDSNKTK